MNLTAEKERLLQRDAEWAKVASEGREVERILSYWTEDAIIMPPGLPTVVGKAALRQYVEGSSRFPDSGLLGSRRMSLSHLMNNSRICSAGMR